MVPFLFLSALRENKASLCSAYAAGLGMEYR